MAPFHQNFASEKRQRVTFGLCCSLPNPGIEDNLDRREAGGANQGPSYCSVGGAVLGRLCSDGEGVFLMATGPTDPWVLGAEGNESIKNGQEDGNLKA